MAQQHLLDQSGTSGFGDSFMGEFFLSLLRGFLRDLMILQIPVRRSSPWPRTSSSCCLMARRRDPREPPDP